MSNLHRGKMSEGIANQKHTKACFAFIDKTRSIMKQIPKCRLTEIIAKLEKETTPSGARKHPLIHEKVTAAKCSGLIQCDAVALLEEMHARAEQAGVAEQLENDFKEAGSFIQNMREQRVGQRQASAMR